MFKIYVCGPTVYSDVHIGNLRAIIAFDFILKSRQFLLKPYNFVHNITDIDDKIINRSIEENKTEKEISEKYTKGYLALLKKLNISTISKIEKVTDNVPLLIEFIQMMIDKGHAYVVQDGVLFNTKSIENYGMVSNLKTEFGISEEVNPNKINKEDFYLWKATEKGIKYDSPWIEGRPGWHTECAALIYKNFGNEGIDVHGGGRDLVFPHHENENAQYLSLFDQPITKEWRITGQINLDNVKMSKSLGNTIKAADFIKQNGPDFLRMIILSHKFSSEINIDDNLNENIEKILKKYRKSYKMFMELNIFEKRVAFGNIDINTVLNSTSEYVSESVKSIMESLEKYDFHDILFKLDQHIKNVNKDIDKIENLQILGIVFNVFKFQFIKDYVNDKVEKVYLSWQQEIKNKNYKEADKLRQKLIKKGWM